MRTTKLLRVSFKSGQPTQQRVTDFSRTSAASDELQYRTESLPRHYTFFKSARSFLDHYYLLYQSRNIISRASGVQWKRDWHSIGYLTERRILKKEGMLGKKLDEKYFTRWATRWRSVHATIPDTHNRLLTQVEEALHAVKEGSLEKHMGHSLKVRTSSLPEHNRSFKSGNGLFCSGGVIEPGTVVTMMPGQWYIKTERGLRRWHNDTEGNMNGVSPYHHSRRLFLDKAVLDSDLNRVPSLQSNASPDEMKEAETDFYKSMAEELQGQTASSSDSEIVKIVKTAYLPFAKDLLNKTLQRRGTPHCSLKDWAVRDSAHLLIGKRGVHDFALGHHINHCGNERESNVMLMPCSYPVTFPRELLPYLPHRLQHSIELSTVRDRYRRTLPDVEINFTRLGDTQAKNNHLLIMCPGLVAVATKQIEDGEELLTNMRFRPNTAMRANYPLWYRQSVEGKCEDWLGNNLYHPRTTFPTRAVGLFDPDVTLLDAMRNPRLFDTDLMYLITRTLRLV